MALKRLQNIPGMSTDIRGVLNDFPAFLSRSQVRDVNVFLCLCKTHTSYRDLHRTKTSNPTSPYRSGGRDMDPTSRGWQMPTIAVFCWSPRPLLVKGCVLFLSSVFFISLSLRCFRCWRLRSHQIEVSAWRIFVKCLSSCSITVVRTWKIVKK